MFLELFGTTVISDGAMGTMLREFGLPSGQRSDTMNMTSPASVSEVHRMYVDAGSDIIYTNTFGANADALEGSGYTPEEIIGSAVKAARGACKEKTMVALDIGPIGMLLEPMGNAKHDHIYSLFSQQAILGEKFGADLVAIETMSDIAELKTAVRAVKENTKLPIIATMTFSKTGHTYLGCTPDDLSLLAEEYGLSAIGLNCSLAPSEMEETVRRFASTTKLPLVIKPNTGLPDAETGSYGIGIEDFATQILELTRIIQEMDSSGPPSTGSESHRCVIIGGCCGTTPEYICELRRLFS